MLPCQTAAQASVQQPVSLALKLQPAPQLVQVLVLVLVLLLELELVLGLVRGLWALEPRFAPVLVWLVLLCQQLVL